MGEKFGFNVGLLGRIEFKYIHQYIVIFRRISSMYFGLFIVGVLNNYILYYSYYIIIILFLHILCKIQTNGIHDNRKGEQQHRTWTDFMSGTHGGR